MFYSEIEICLDGRLKCTKQIIIIMRVPGRPVIVRFNYFTEVYSNKMVCNSCYNIECSRNILWFLKFLSKFDSQMSLAWKKYILDLPSYSHCPKFRAAIF